MSGCSRQDQGEFAKNPLLVKYLNGTSNEWFRILKKDHQSILVRQSRDSTTMIPLTKSESANGLTYPELTSALRECGISITNDLAASDIVNLIWLLMHGGPSDFYLVESVGNKDYGWQVHSRYYEAPPDNCNRWPSGYTIHLYLDQEKIITNIVVNSEFRTQPDTNEMSTEQSDPAYPPQGVGTADP